MRLVVLLVLVPCAAFAGACGPAEGAARGTDPRPGRAVTRAVAHGDVAETFEANADGSARASAAALVAYADAALDVGDTAGARLHLRDAARLAGDATTAVGLARASDHVGDTAAAAVGYQRYLALAPRGRWAPTARARLNAFGVAFPGSADLAAPLAEAPNASARAASAAGSRGKASVARRTKGSRARGSRPTPAKRRVAASEHRPDSALPHPATIAAETTLAAPGRKGPSRWVRVRNWVTHRGTVVGAAAGAAVGFAVGNVPGAIVMGAATGRALGSKPAGAAPRTDSARTLAPPARAPRPTVPLGP